MKESNVDVLVIGAGPAGLMCANGLAAAGVNVKVIDIRPDKVTAGHADGIQPRTIEVMQSYGLAERLLREGAQMHMFAFYNPSSKGGIELSGRVPNVVAPTARYQFLITLGQAQIEDIFLNSMQSMGLQVDRPMMPTSLQISQDEAKLEDPNSYPVQVTLQHLAPVSGQDATEIVNAKFVVGTDGAHSWVRKALTIAMEGEQTDQIWGVIDMVPETDFPDIRNGTIVQSNNGSCMIIPREGDTVRLYIQLDEKDDGDGKVQRMRGNMGPDELLAVAKKTIHPYQIKTPSSYDWHTIYSIGQRVASNFSVKERVFIAGDACHTHSPKTGQGMNASMNDTHNLIWKLTHVIRGWADISLLKTYEFERRKYAQDLINYDKEWTALFSENPQSEDAEASLAAFLKAFHAYGEFASGVGVEYASSSIVNLSHQSVAPNLIIGQRVLPHMFIRAADSRPYELQDMMPSDCRFKVLVFVGDTSQSTQREKVARLAEEMGGPDGFLKRFAPQGDIDAMFDIISISSAKKTNVRYNELPELFRPHWSRVLLDDTDATETIGGNAYAKFGIQPSGAVVIVRPDGYIGMMAPFDRIQDINTYFAVYLANSRCRMKA